MYYKYLFKYFGVIIVTLAIFLPIYMNQKEEIEILNKEKAALNNRVQQLQKDSAELELMLRNKDLQINLSVRGIPERKGGGVVVKNIQKQ